ncbi:MAG: hypothetical protein FWD57_05605 [Polyangiaceae bacterium]|nr:hypothetical protein [Polyangiaceae bacterium]
MSFRLQSILPILALLLGLLTTSQAKAWVEQSILAQDTKIVLMRSGTARIQHQIKFSVKGGPLRSMDIHIADTNIGFSGEPTLVRTGGAMDARVPIAVSAEQRPDGTLRVEMDGGSGIRRGIYELAITYTSDLLRQNGATRDGSMILLSWVGPKWDDGIDSVKTTFVIPSSATEPSAIGEAKLGGPNDEIVTAPLGAVLSTLAKLPEYDELELVRPHVASGETVVWKVRIDPSVLGEANDPRLSVAPATEVIAISPERRATYLGIGGLLALAFSILVTLKHHQVVQSCRIRGVTARPVVPIGVAVRMAFAGPLLAASIGAQIFLEHPLPGALGVLGAALLASYRSPIKTVSPRGPGRWLPLSDKDAFEKKENWPLGTLDAGSPLGKVLFGMVTIAYGFGVWQLAKHGTYFAYTAGLDYVVVLAVFGTGRRSELPADSVFSAIPILKEIASDLRKSRKLGPATIRGLARIPAGSCEPDELRLVVQPKKAMQGFRSMEIGLGWIHGAGGPTPLPQVLLRVVENSPCHESITKKLRKPRWVRGRESYERVLILNPTLPTTDITTKLAEKLCQFVRAEPTTEQAAAPEVSRVTRRVYTERSLNLINTTRWTPSPASVCLGD